jgi:hypothetical protein
MTLGWGLILATFLLTAFGAALYVDGLVGWAQLFWVMASGTAGGSVALFVEHWVSRGQPPDKYWRQWRRPPTDKEIQ